MMRRYVSLLRGINVSGQKKIKMADLRKLYAAVGFTNIKSYLQSGNVAFDSEIADKHVLAQTIGAEITAQYRFDVPILVLSAEDVQSILASTPYTETRSDGVRQLYFTFAYTPLDPTSEIALPANVTDTFTITKCGIYTFYANGAGRSKLTNNFFERKLKTTLTMRNWKTVNALVTLLETT